jgi:hypothetical protein
MSTTKRRPSKGWALGFLFTVGALVMPACEIKIGPGTAADGPTDPTGGATEK